VISKPGQQSQADLKASYLRTQHHMKIAPAAFRITSHTNDNIKTWVGSDKDGDPTTNHAAKLEAKFGVDLRERNFSEIAAFLLEELSKGIPHEARRAYIKKKGVDGLEDIIRHMDGLSHVRSLADFTTDKFDKFKTYLSQIRYDEGDRTETSTNIAMDMVLDLLPCNKGFVISDFPEDQQKAKQLLYQLLFAAQASNDYLQDNGVSTRGNHGQVFLPLCEEQESIEHFQHAVKSIYEDIERTINAINTDASLSQAEKDFLFKHSQK
jgi:hypothetical protein